MSHCTPNFFILFGQYGRKHVEKDTGKKKT